MHQQKPDAVEKHTCVVEKKPKKKTKPKTKNGNLFLDLEGKTSCMVFRPR
jgi:hypothetical protein